MDGQKSGAQGHSRNKSITKASRPRSSTKGPLDLDDDPLRPATAPSPRPQSTQRLNPSQRKTASRQGSPLPRSPGYSPSPRPGESLPKDFSFLLRPEIYHALTPLNVPLAFRNSPKQPSPDAPIAELVSKGFFRAAAIAAVQELTNSSTKSSPIEPKDYKRIFSLVYARLACLTLIDATSLAAQEVKAFEDLNNASIYVDDETGEHLVPWDLRVLNVRLQALGFGDPRRAVMSYYELARETRDHISRAAAKRDNTARELWKERLYDLGIKVAGALVEMEDLSGAAHHLTTLKDRGDGKMELSRALLWLHIGDSDAARRAVQGAASEGDKAEKVVMALADMSDGEFVAALDKWKGLKDDDMDEMVGINMAVCLLYVAKMEEARAVLEELVGKGYSSHTLLNNLSTTYELCTDRNKALKLALTERIASMEESEKGWEKSNADFKL